MIRAPLQSEYSAILDPVMSERVDALPACLHDSGVVLVTQHNTLSRRLQVLWGQQERVGRAAHMYR